MTKTARIRGPIINFEMSGDGKIRETQDSRLLEIARRKGYEVKDEREIVTPAELRRLHDFIMNRE